MFHLIAFFESLTSTSLVEVNAVTDNVLTIESNRFALRKNFDLLWAQVNGTDVAQARLVTPTFRQITPPNIAPLNVATEPGADPNVADFRERPLRLPANEDLTLEAANAAAAANAVYAVLAIADGVVPRPGQGRIYTLRGTSTSTLTANAWTEIDTTWDDTLPAGSYRVVGLRGETAGGIAVRIRFEDQLLRPGVLANDGVADKGWPPQRYGGLGVFGAFDSRTMPTIEFLSLSADTAETVWLDIQRVG